MFCAFAQVEKSTLSAVTGSKTVANDAQFWVIALMASIAVPGTPATAPCEVTAPSAVVRSRPADRVPVAAVIVDDAPVVVDVSTKAARWLSQVTFGPPVNAAAMIVAAFEKLVAADRLIELEVLTVPSTVTISVPDSALSWASVMLASDPPRR